jgi:hypothetical protein
MLYRKKNIPVRVEFADQAGRMATLEGEVAYQAGAALLTGLKHERWPVERAYFDLNYSPQAPTRAGEAGLYIKKYRPVTAQQTQQPCAVEIGTAGQCIHAQAGDWLVTDSDGQRWVVAADIFAESYELLMPL